MNVQGGQREEAEGETHKVGCEQVDLFEVCQELVVCHGEMDMDVGLCLLSCGVFPLLPLFRLTLIRETTK